MNRNLYVRAASLLIKVVGEGDVADYANARHDHNAIADAGNEVSEGADGCTGRNGGGIHGVSYTGCGHA